MRSGVRLDSYSRQATPPGEEIWLIGVRFDRVPRPVALNAMEVSFHKKRSTKVYIVNAHTLNLASRDPFFRQVLNAADLLFNDGTGVQLASRLAGKPFHDNLVGTDLTPQICARAANMGVSVFLLGGHEGVAERAAEGLAMQAQGVQIAGTHHGYFHESENETICDLINRSGAGILLVAFGNPRQEIWIHENAHRLNVDMCIGVGGLFDHLSGRLRRAPRWMRRIGIEWVHILLGQPHKWRRYIIGNPVFLMRVARERLRMRG